MSQRVPKFVALWFVVAFSVSTLCTIAGCWQEIEYTGPDPVAAKGAAPPADVSPTTANHDAAPAATQTASPAADPALSGFAEDLANSLSGEPAPPPDSTDTTDTTVATAAPPADDPYAFPFETTDDSADPKPTEPDSLFPPSESEPVVNSPIRSDTVLPASPAEPPVTADVSPAPPEAAPPVGLNSRLAAWSLGSDLSLAALANDRGVGADNVRQWLADAQSQATALETSIGSLPETGAGGNSATASKQVLSFLVVQGQQVGRDLARRHGLDHAALCEVAVKSNLLLVLYSPGSQSTEAIAGAISRAATRAQLPSQLWQPLLDTLVAKAEPATVRKAVQDFHAEVARYLTAAAEQ